MRAFPIGGRAVGEGAPVFLIAELSANHGHQKDIALQTIEAAAKAGADAIKLQTYTPDTLTLKSNAAPFVVNTKNAWSGRTLYDLYEEAMTPWEWHAELKAAAEAVGLLCFSTPFDSTAVAFLDSLDVPAYKVASFELNDLPLVEHIARAGKPMILSTGMASLGDIDAAVATCREAGNEQLALLRCVSSYPAKPEAMDLASFDVLRGFDTVIGLSDHTRDATVAIASVALGAKLIEKHFILDRSVGGPDSFFSLEPAEFSAMARAVRDAERALGRPRFGPSTDEQASMAFRRSLFVARDVKAGSTLTCDDVRSVRPANGMHPRHLPDVLGRRATRDLRTGTPLTWDAVDARPGESVHLRAATAGDAERLLAWRNDPHTRAMSLSTASVGEAEHLAWLTRTLTERDRVLLVAESDGLAIGTVRLDGRSHGEWAISLTVAPDDRGKGYSTSMLRAAEGMAMAHGAIRLTALIKRENLPSIRAFKAAGYYAFTEEEGAFRCERRLVPYPR